MLGRMSVRSWPRCVASSRRSWTISNGMRASTNAWYQPSVCSSTLAAVKPCRLLRIDQPDARQRPLVSQVLLPGGVTAVQILHRLEPAWVVQHAGELGEPGTQPVGDAVGHPQANLGLALDAVLPAVGLLDTDAEDADDRLAAHGGAKFLAVLAVGPRRRESAAGLAVGEQRGGELADALHVQRTGRAAARVGDDARVGIDPADLGVPETPEVEEPLLMPEDVGARAGSCGSLVRGSSWPDASRKFLRQCSQ